MVVVGTSRRAARIVAGSRAVGVLELLLRTLSFDCARSPVMHALAQSKLRPNWLWNLKAVQ